MPTKLSEREEDVQACIIEGLTRLGYIVLQTTVRYKACWNCGERQRGGYGASEGVPDLLVSHVRWPAGMFLGLECKGTSGVPSAAQKTLLTQRRIFIVRCWEDALKVVSMIGKAQVSE